MPDLTDLERRVVETSITVRLTWIEYFGKVRGADETSEQWTIRKEPARQRWLIADRAHDRAVDELLMGRVMGSKG